MEYRSTALVLIPGQDGGSLRDYLIKNKISFGWSVGERSEDRHRDFRQYSAEEIRRDNPSGDDRMSVVNFLGIQADEDKNVQIGDDVIVYAPDPQEVVVGVFTVSEDAEYEPDPVQLTDETDYYYYYRDVVPKPWNKPVSYSEFDDHYSGDKPVCVPLHTTAIQWRS